MKKVNAEYQLSRYFMQGLSDLFIYEQGGSGSGQETYTKK